MFRFAQFLGSEGISVSLSSVDYDPYTQYNYLFKLDGEYVDDQISKKLDPEIQALEKLIQESTSTGQFTCVTAGDPTITIGGTTIAPTVAVNTACFSNCQGTVTSVTGGTGTTSTGGSTPAISLTNTGVSAGSYTSTNITVDAQGRITAAANGSGGGGGAGVVNVTASHGLSSSGGTNPNITIIPAQTDITSIKNTALNVGRDDDNLIKFNTDNEIVFEVGGTDGVTFKCAGEIEASSLDISGNVDVDGTLETDALSLNGTAITRTAAQINAARPGTVTSVCKGDNTITIGGTATDPTVAVNSACFTDCEGTVTCVTGGTGITASAGNTPEISIDATQSSITSIKNSSLCVGRDNNNQIKFDTNNQIIFDVQGNSGVVFKCGGEIEASSLDISGSVDIDGTLETDALSIASTSVDATAAEINQIHGITDGTVAANKAVIVDCNKDITGFRNITLTGELDAASLDISGNVDIDGTLETDVLSLNGTAITRTACQINDARPGTVTTVGIVGTQGITVVSGSPVTAGGDINLKVSDACNTKWNQAACNGTVTSITTTGAYLTGGTITCSGNIGIDYNCAASWDAKTTCTGTVESITTTGAYLTGGTITCSGNIGIDYNCAASWDAKTTCTGTVGSVGLSGTQGIDIIDGSPVTGCDTICLKVSDACNTAWNAKTTCEGTVTCVTGGDGLTGSVDESGSLAVDTTVARTNVDEIFSCDLTVTRDINSQNNILSSGVNLDTLFLTEACNGTVTCITTTGAYLTGGTITSSGNIGIDYNCATSWDSKTTCTGTVESITTTGVYLTGGTITCAGDIGLNYNCATSWDAKTTCTGTVGSVGLSGTQGINIIGGSPVTGCDTICLKIDNTCNTAWNAKTTCTGTVCSAGLALSASECGTILAVKDVCNSAWNAKTTCTGTVCSAGLALSAGACGTILAVKDVCNSAWNAKTTCEGTVTSVNCGDATITIGGTATDPTIAVNASCFTNCEGTVISVGGSNNTIVVSGTTTAPTLSVNELCFSNCQGTVTSVNCGDSTITIGGSPTAPTIAVNSACFTDCEGTVTCVTGGDGLTGNITTSGSLAVDTSVARTNIDEVFSCDLTVQGDLTVTGDITCLETIISTTSALSVTNSGTGPALVVNQTGCNDIIDFRDDNNSVFYIEDGGNIGLGTTDPNYKLDVTGDINSQNHILSSGVNLDTLFLTEACNGTVTCIDVSGGICGGPITTSGTLSIDTACNTKWDQSTCPGINATGTVQSVTTTGVYLTGGTITCTGDIGVNYNCATSWDAKTTCTGTVDSVAIGGTQGITVVNGSPITQCGTINLKITDACNTAWNAKTTCTGTVESITTTGVYLTGGTITCTGDIGLNYNCATSWDAKTTCTGTVNCLGDLGISATAAELNYTTNVTSDIQAQLDAKGTGTVCSLGDLGITATATELNYTTNVTSDIQAQLDAKGSGTVCCLSDLGITTTAAKLNFSSNVCADIQTQLNNKSPLAGSTSITTVGTIGTGTWQGTAIADAYIASASDWNACATSTQGTAADNALPKAGGTMCGNIVMGSDDITFTAGGTVDGRDVSADGAKLDDIACGAEVNVQSNWNASSGDALILNKPTIPTDNSELCNGCNYTTCTGTVSALGDLGITATAAELNYTTNVCADIQTQLNDKSPTAGSTSITTVGTIGTGTWQGTAIADAYIASASDWNACATSTQGTAADNALPKAGGDMSGNIVMAANDITFTAGGTVDGRDVSADGAKLDGIACGAEVNVQSNWNAASGDALILNKPTIPTNNNQLTNGCNYGTGTVCSLSDLSITATAAELNFTTNVTSDIQAQLDAKGSGTVCSLGDLGITATAAELNYTTNVTSDIQAQLDAKGTGTVCSLGDLGITAPACAINYTSNVTSDIQAQLDASCSKTTCTGNICSSTAQCIYDSDENFCLGSNAGEDLTSGIRNTMLGKCAGRCITTGQNNIAIGFRAQEKNCEQNYNTALGFCSMFCGGGCGNAAIGQQAMQNSTADNSVAIGKCTLRSATGNSNTAIGAQALQGMTSGENNFGLGAIAGFALQTGNSNVFIGQDASRYKVSGNNDVAIGKRAGRCYASGNRTSGADNIFIGQDTKAGTNGGSNEIVIGCGAVGQGTNTAMIGNSSTTHLYIYGCYSTVSDRRDKTCICDLELGLEFIKELKPKTFNTIADRCDPTGSITGKKHGFIAQDIIALEGEDNVIVSNKNPDRLSYTGEHIIPILVKGMQEQQLVIDNLASEVKDLKNKLESL